MVDNFSSVVDYFNIFCVGGVNSDRSQRFATEEVDLELLEYVFLGRVV